MFRCSTDSVGSTPQRTCLFSPTDSIRHPDQAPRSQKKGTWDRKKLRALAVEEMRKLHARGPGATAPDAAAAAMEEAAHANWPRLQKREIRKKMNKNSLATLFEALAAGSQPTEESAALLDTVAGHAVCCSQATSGPATGEATAPCHRTSWTSRQAARAAAQRRLRRCGGCAAATAPPSPAGSTPSGVRARERTRSARTFPRRVHALLPTSSQYQVYELF